MSVVVQLNEHPRFTRAAAGTVDRAALQRNLITRGLPSSRAQIEKWKADGMPHESDGRGRRCWFDLEAVLAWLTDHGYDPSRLVQPAQREAN